jgi:hypothetical protein
MNWILVSSSRWSGDDGFLFEGFLADIRRANFFAPVAASQAAAELFGGIEVKNGIRVNAGVQS